MLVVLYVLCTKVKVIVVIVHADMTLT